MNRRFQCGLIVGKFSPLHRGHELLIERALNQCERVLIISYCKPEFPGCEAEQRRSWLNQLFPDARVLVLADDDLVEWNAPARGFPGVPANADDETTHRRFCASLCLQVLRQPVQAVFTSEDYGDAFARELTTRFREVDPAAPAVQHVLVDRTRRLIPVSGTMLRRDVHRYRKWLSPPVYASFVQRVCLLGGESTGKSVLARELAGQFQTRFVPEYGRELWEARKGNLQFQDLLHIAQSQVAREDEAAGTANRYLFCDTSPLTTLFYSRHLFSHADPELERLAARRYHTVALCAPDFPFVQDGTRQDAAFRLLQHDWYLRQLAERGVIFVLAEGSIEQRSQTVRAWLHAQGDGGRSLREP